MDAEWETLSPLEAQAILHYKFSPQLRKGALGGFSPEERFAKHGCLEFRDDMYFLTEKGEALVQIMLSTTPTKIQKIEMWVRNLDAGAPAAITKGI